jgi:hypothetical protein
MNQPEALLIVFFFFFFGWGGTDFVTLLISEVFEPKYGLFSCTAKTNLFYPATTSPLMGSNYIHLFEFIGKVKYIYDNNNLFID